MAARVYQWGVGRIHLRRPFPLYWSLAGLWRLDQWVLVSHGQLRARGGYEPRCALLLVLGVALLLLVLLAYPDQAPRAADEHEQQDQEERQVDAPVLEGVRSSSLEALRKASEDRLDSVPSSQRVPLPHPPS